jgi:tetratricopeptide (TPR) repeat protein
MGDYAKAIQAGSEFLAAARKVNSPADIEAADETLGGILVNLERYPEALPRFQEALAVSTSQKEDTSYQALHCTEVFWHLGRYGEAEAMLTSIPPQGANHPDVKSGIALAKAEIRLSQRRFGEAYQIASNSLKTFSDLPPGKLYRFRQVEARSENESGRTRKALEDAQALLNEARKQQDDWTIADASRLVATICVKDCQPDQISAESAAKYFHDKQQPESEWLTLACLARLYQRQKDMGLAEASAKKALDIVSSFQHTWSSPAFQLYSSRPDIHQALADLSRLRQD